MDESAPRPPPAAAAPAAPPRGTRARRWVAGLVVGVLLVAGALVAAVGWMLRTEPGTAWLLARAPLLQVTAPKGALFGDFEAARVEVPLNGGALVLQSAGWRGLRVEPAFATPWLRLEIDELYAARVDLRVPPSSGQPPTVPTDLRLPVEIDVRSLRVAALYIDALGTAPLRDLAAHVHLGDEAGAVHRVEGLSLVWDRLRASGSANLRSDAPLAVSAGLALTQQAQPGGLRWGASASLAGPLAEPMLQATLRAEAEGSAKAPPAPQSLDLHAALRPFAAWPLGELQARAQGFDLSALHDALPATALDGEARARSTAFDQPADVSIRLTNRAAGLWSDARLPLRTLQLDARARPDQPGTIELRALDAELGTQQASAGRLQGHGVWSRERWALGAMLLSLQPSLLDARAAPMLLSGPLNLIGDGSDANANVDVKAELAGQLARSGPARAVQLKLDGRVSAQRIELRDAQARAGKASASLSGVAQRVDAHWQLKARATLVDFDPLPWWPGRDDSVWRRGPHKLNAQADLELRLPEAAPASIAQGLAALRGQAQVGITKSLLGGVPIGGELSLRSTDERQAQANLSLDLDGNRVRAQGRLDTRASGADDRWDLTLDAPALARLAPLWRLARGSPAAMLAGAATASAQLSGRWPAIGSSGQAAATRLRLDTARVERAQARWQLGTRADAPVELQATLTQAAIGTQSIESAELQLQGTGRAHRIELRGVSKALPPAWVDVVQADQVTSAAPPETPAPASNSVALLSAQGGLVDDAAGQAAGWRGTVAQLTLGSSHAASPPWVRSRDVALELQWAGAAPRLTLQPGRAEILGAVLRWSRIAWQGASGTLPAQIEAQAVLDPLRVAPLLARAQPDFGWGGDLTITGRLDIHSAPGFQADIVLERQAGDLSVTDETGTQALGLTDLRLGLNAVDGVWSFTQGLAGKTLGVAAGAIVARTSPQASWPSPDTPIQGVLELQVANLGTWGTWVPAGWRLGGTLRTSAGIGGRFGAPEYTGEMRGQGLSVRNFVQGVNVSDGEVAITLQGGSARIDTFKARAGAGTVTLEGGATFGAAPELRLGVVADKFQLLGRVDRRIVASGRGQLTLDPKTLAFDGEFGVDEGLIDFTRGDAPSLSDDVEVVRRKNGSAPAAARPTQPAPAATKVQVDLDLRVKLGERLRVRGRGLDTGLRGELRITSPGNVMAVNGSVATFEGNYAAYGQKLAIDRGVLSFNGPVANPRLDIEATRPNLDLRVGVQVSGSAQNPRVRLFSEPEVSDVDKLSYLVLGRASEGLGQADTALLQRAAMALLAGEGEGPTDQLIKAIGLDELSLRQAEGEVRATVISLGKQLSRRWYVGYERGLNATSGTWQLIYRVAQRFTLRAQSGLDNSLDLIWTWRWQ